MRDLWEEAELRTSSESLDGGHEAALRPEPPARPPAAQGQGHPGLRLHEVPQSRQSRKSRLESATPPPPSESKHSPWKEASPSRATRSRTSSARPPASVTASAAWAA